MAKIAFFSDDEAGVLCARLACLGLSASAGTTTLALPGDVVAASTRPAPAAVSVLALPACLDALAGGRAGRAAFEGADDLVVALPLQASRDRGVRDRFDAAVAVGVGEAAAARALRTARYVASHEGGAVDSPAPAWFLPMSGQSELRAKAMLCASGRLQLPFATRALPMALPRLTPADRDGLAAWEPNANVVGTGLLLAALVLCVAADPGARRLEPRDIADRMAARTSAAERALSDRLVALAESYGRLDGAVAGSAAPVRRSRRRAMPSRPEASGRRVEVVRCGARLRRA